MRKISQDGISELIVLVGDVTVQPKIQSKALTIYV